jgi:hypothetical protein
MPSIRPEVLAFKKAAEKLHFSDTNKLPLSDDEMEQVADCLAKVEKVLQDGQM